MKKALLFLFLATNSVHLFSQANCFDDIVPVLEQYYKEGKIQQAKDYIKEIEELCDGSPTPSFLAIKKRVYAYGKTETVQPQASTFFTTYAETVNGVSFKMVAIPGGSFNMGSNEGTSAERPVHLVTVPQFYMGETEVTQALWQAVMGSNPSRFKGDNNPVESVNWDDCQAFIKKLNALTGKRYRLPSEAEWEYACRSGTTTPFHTGDNLTTSQANYDGNYPYKNYPKGVYRQKTTPVKTFSANAYGLYDMHGNVWEWCEDRWHENYTGAPTDGSAWVSGSSSARVLRGGSWIIHAERCRSADRYLHSSGFRDNDFGFRVVAEYGL